MTNLMGKIYIYTPAGLTTGGGELLHQLADLLTRNGREAYIVYQGEGGKPVAYECYNTPTAVNIEDDEKNTIVIFEAQRDMRRKLKDIKNARIILWWLSIDNYFVGARRDIATCDMLRWSIGKGLELLASRLLKTLSFKGNKFRGNISFAKTLADERILHGYQCEYAHYFLMSRGLRNLAPLKDYINTDHIGDIDYTGREDIVLYNPVKGYAFTKKLIAASEGVRWVALRGMTRDEVIGWMRKAKLYVDFGNHPGKDRMPRECAMNGCCVITGRRGAADFLEDVPLPAGYKVDEKNTPISTIVTEIRRTLAEYDQRAPQFDHYREVISREKEEFERQALTLFQ